jgi:hypothetical protein
MYLYRYLYLFQKKMFIRLPEERRLFYVAELRTGRGIAGWLADQFDLSCSELRMRIEQQGRQLTDWDALIVEDNGPVTVLLGGGLLGGKGGFGSMLR